MNNHIGKLEYNIYGNRPFQRHDDNSPYIIGRQGKKLKIRLPDRGLITLEISNTGKVHVIGKQQTKKGGFTKKLDKKVPYPAEDPKSTSWYGELKMGPLIKMITEFLNSCQKNVVIREKPKMEPEKFEDVRFLRHKKRITRASNIRDCEFITLGFIRRDNKIITEGVGSPDLEEDIWLLFECTSDTGSMFRVIYRGGDSYYHIKKTKVGYSLTTSKLPSSHYQYMASGGRYSKKSEPLTMNDKALLDFAMEIIMKGPSE
jgi:hypothetical protein